MGIAAAKGGMGSGIPAAVWLMEQACCKFWTFLHVYLFS